MIRVWLFAVHPCQPLTVGRLLCRASFEVVLTVLRLADMMRLAFAKEWCEQWLASSDVLDIWNVCTMLCHAHNCDASQVRFADLTALCFMPG